MRLNYYDIVGRIAWCSMIFFYKNPAIRQSDKDFGSAVIIARSALNDCNFYGEKQICMGANLRIGSYFDVSKCNK